MNLREALRNSILHLVVTGVSDAGIAAALRAREIDPKYKLQDKCA